MRVAIIGAGVIGVGIGRELSGRGVEVEVLEAAYPESGASGRSIGVSSVQQKDPRLARLAMEGIGISREIDRVLKEEFNMPTGVMGEQVPHASIALSEQDRARLSRYFEYWRAAGAEAREMSPREVKEELMPWIDEGSFVSAFVTFSDFKLMYFPLVRDLYAAYLSASLISRGEKVLLVATADLLTPDGYLVRAGEAWMADVGVAAPLYALGLVRPVLTWPEELNAALKVFNDVDQKRL